MAGDRINRPTRDRILTQPDPATQLMRSHPHPTRDHILTRPSDPATPGTRQPYENRLYSITG